MHSLLSKCMESQTRNILLIPVRNTLFLTSLSIWQKTRYGRKLDNTALTLYILATWPVTSDLSLVPTVLMVIERTYFNSDQASNQ